MSNISTCEAVELVRNAIDPYSMMGISADDMVYASVKRHMLSLFEKPEGECLHRISFAEFADKVTKTTRIQGWNPSLTTLFCTIRRLHHE